MKTGLETDRGLILVVEDNQTFRHLLSDLLRSRGFDVREAENGLVAKTIFDLNYDRIKVILSDIRMPEMDGVELLKYVSKSKIPFILMTGFSEVLEIHDAYRLGANAFLAKPFSDKMLLEAIDNCLNSPIEFTPNVPAAEQSIKYCAVDIDEFLTTSKFRSDIYIKLGAEKFVKVAHKGEEVPLERLKVYKERTVKQLYMTMQDFANYVDFSVKLTSLALQSKSVNRSTRLRLLKSTTEAVIEKCFMGSIDSTTLEPARQMVEETMNLVSEDDRILDVFSSFANSSNRIFAQGVCVAVYSCMIAKRHGWNSANTLFRVSLAGLLHDIGLKELPQELLIKDRIYWTSEEVRLFETHPTRGHDILAQLRGLPEDIAIIVHDHHETPHGTGYPHHKRASSIHPLAALIGTVARFVEMVIPLTDAAVALSPIEALDQIRHVYSEEVDLTYLRHLIEILMPQNGKGVRSA